MEWQKVAEQAQSAVHLNIPSRWRLPESFKGSRNVMTVPRDCGALTDRQIEITDLAASQLVERLSKRELSSYEVTEAFCARAAIAHQLVNCLCAFFPEDALKRAKELDAILENTGKPVGILHGLPVAIKDTYSLEGHPATFGYICKKDAVVGYDSAVPSILRSAGAVFYCRTTMPQTGMALETVSNLFGRTLNPHNSHFGAGGSSGGDGALVALKGSPFAPSTDIGGSIRLPAAVNGLYGIRPTADRIPKTGMQSVENAGQLSIRVSCGPVANCLADVKMITRLLVAHPDYRYDTTCMPVPWRSPEMPKKLVLGIMMTDGVVQPHPPVLRALKEISKAALDAGHEVIPFQVPFDCWEAYKTTFKIYWPNGSRDLEQQLQLGGEEMIPVVKQLIASSEVRPLQGSEVLECNRAMMRYKKAFRKAWDETTSATSAGRPMDALICPAAPAFGIPHDFNIWWGYTSLFNLIDYPSTILPLPKIKVDAEVDVKDTSYEPSTASPFDKANFDMYDAKLFIDQPATVQIVGRPFDDETLLEVTQALDDIVKA